jgi:hypothetical protein
MVVMTFRGNLILNNEKKKKKKSSLSLLPSTRQMKAKKYINLHPPPIPFQHSKIKTKKKLPPIPLQHIKKNPSPQVPSHSTMKKTI